MLIDDNSKTVAIVTSFIDIGRGNWEGWSNRSQDKYFEYFNNIANLKNPMYIYVDDSLKSRVLDLRKNNPTYFIECNPYEDFEQIYKEVKRVLRLQSFMDLIPGHLADHPEYWSIEYVFVTLLKPFFVKLAIDQFDIKEDLVSWVDFGYKRDNDFIGSSLSLGFPDNKITVFSQKNIVMPDIRFSVLNNDIYIIGSPIVGSKENWRILKDLCQESIYELFKQDLIDDDQGIWLMSYLKNPDLFNVIVTSEWFSLFKYNMSHLTT